MTDSTNLIDDPLRGRTTLTVRGMRLSVRSGPDAGREVAVEADVVRLGSRKGVDLRLTDDTVSRDHAELLRGPQGIVLRDLDSTNGTFVGDVRIREAWLAPGQAFRVGLTELVVVPEDATIPLRPSAATRFDRLVGRSLVMREVFALLERVAPTELTVLVTGETGTGKELAARALHARSARAEGPFVALNCGAVPENLVESELFGHERGAFTGAVAARPGLFEQATGGTLFLDEIGELPLAVQPTLLRVLEQREVRRVGGRRANAVDVRVVAATNRDLRAEVAAGRFREDLYYRLAVVEVGLPPLRERVGDLPVLASALLDDVARQQGEEPATLTDDVLAVLAAWRWPGNVRELRNVLQRALPFRDGPAIELHALPEALRRPAPPGPSEPEDPTGDEPTGPRTRESVPLPDPSLGLKEAKDRILASFERRYLEDLLDRAEGNASKAARLAGVDRKTIGRLLKRHGLR